jgi:hypothetical protein
MPRTSPTTGREVDVVDHEAAELTRLQDDLVPARASPGGRGPHRFTTDHQRYEPIMLELNRVVGAPRRPSRRTVTRPAIENTSSSRCDT